MTSLTSSARLIRAIGIRLILPVIFASLFFCGCGASGTNSPGSQSSSDADLSYTVDGQHFALKNPMTIDGKTTAPLYINAVSNDPVTGTVKIEITVSPTSEVFKFKVDNKGTTSILHYTPSFSATKYEGTYMNTKLKNFYADSVTCTINQLTDTRVSGTFSGKFIDGDSKQSLQMTNGSFDIPVPPAK
jgi:hypothetical protein